MLVSAKGVARRRPGALLHVAIGFDSFSALKVLNNEGRNHEYLIEKGQTFIGVVFVNSL
nr:hypothetical protein [Xenorhabdus hominickii]